MAEITDATAVDIDEFWQDTPQDVTGATEAGEQGEKSRGCGCDCHKPAGTVHGSSWEIQEFAEVTVTDPAALRELLAYLAADKNEQEDQ